MADHDRFALRTVRIEQVRREADGVVSLELVDPSGADLPPWAPGAHVDIVLPSRLVRQYSLCGRPDDRSSYRIAILRDEHGKGGSREIHESVLVGKEVQIRGPRNHFKLGEADEYLFVAGGIGITPILTMIRQLDEQGYAYRLVYGGRSRGTMAFQKELDAIGGDVDYVPFDERGQLDLDEILDSVAPWTSVYACGPEGLLRAMEKACEARNLKLNVERFGTAPPPRTPAAAPTAVAAGDGLAATADATPADAAAAGTGDGSFTVELQTSGLVLDVPPDRTILDVVREHLPQVISSCEEGFCGACETPVISGEPDHRDAVLDEHEKEANETMMICISRCKGSKLVLDL
ncbi:PDR/VanB family oxidoreductase [Ammonicoccus fulvus]|uniref:PDR/VanB family oxidoreductase n=1 Tax=Ammonicoccus fulvus TaxID=3138240 RepID=A0ABZ3FML8_9ACTN